MWGGGGRGGAASASGHQGVSPGVTPRSRSPWGRGGEGRENGQMEEGNCNRLPFCHILLFCDILSHFVRSLSLYVTDYVCNCR